jgi:hypothetical protein
MQWIKRLAELLLTGAILSVLGFRWLLEVPYEMVRALFTSKR